MGFEEAAKRDIQLMYNWSSSFLGCVQRERGEREFAADANEFALAVFAARNRVLRVRGEREFAAKPYSDIFYFFLHAVYFEVSCAKVVRYILHVYVLLF